MPPPPDDDGKRHRSLDTTTESQLNPPNHFQIREEFESLVLHDLLGPARGPDEELDERWVSSRYLVGWLAPKDVGRGTKAADARAAAPDDQTASPFQTE